MAQGFIFGGHGVVADEVEHHALQGFAGAEGVDGEHQEVVGVDPQHQVGEDGDVFSDGFFVVGFQVGEGGERLAVDDAALVEQTALANVDVAHFKAKVVFHAGAAVEGGVDPAQVVAFGEVFHRQLPVGFAFKGDLAGFPAQQAQVVGGPAVDDRGQVLLQGRGIAGKIDEHQVQPLVAADGLQPFALPVEPFVGVFCSNRQSGAYF